ncbi:CheR family methyltransferase [Cytophagaceae bacterium YF14B1]|uniref:protein-glutamate O-methyltransferase n=1 Tax=Xanthocytophaga flava TaxID=3048013 RepID=A0AAE3UA86_9BACT|nr:CheR family methyltransferase [Xanthocytophaga flavus]MDJ1482524.1 CheR family methyltransferase [Xanthocytophaga flavus]
MKENVKKQTQKENTDTISSDTKELSEDTSIGSLTKNRRFTIVGMGGSAGSLEAIEEFLQNVPPDSGIAFVLVKHLDPNHESLLPDLLQRCTLMPVRNIEDGMEVHPNHVYVIPENKDLAIMNGQLLLLEPSKPRGFRMPIDNFLQSLAEDWGEKAACIIFSGMGSDGELGARFIKESIGLVIVQDPATATYDSMPRSIIQTGTPDYILSPAEMAGKLIDYIKYPSKKLEKKHQSTDKKMAVALQKVFILLRSQTGHDFSLYKRNTIMRRMERRMQTNQIFDLEEYVRFLQEHSTETENLFKELLIGVTKFFRDAPGFLALEERILPELLKKKGKNDAFRVWIVGCSTGEEAYSIAILIRECINKLKIRPNFKVQIYATDLDADAIKKARSGLYMANISNDMSADRLDRWFIKKDDQYQIVQEIREMVIFAEHNLLKDASFTKLDLLCCRNVLIYFTQELQKKLLPMFHYTLNAGGVLFLGPSETISGHEDLFVSVDVKWKLYRRRDNTSSINKIAEFPNTTILPKLPITLPAQKKQPSRQPSFLTDLTRKLLLEKHTPPAVLIDENGTILYVNGRTGKYLELYPGQMAMNVFDMAREGLGFELRNAVLRAYTQQEPVVINEVRVKTNGSFSLIRLKVDPIEQPLEMKGLLLVVFEDLPQVKKTRTINRNGSTDTEKDRLIAELEKELRFTKEHLQHTIEEMETSVEELKSTNEELQSTNEELQSTNEEANTAKEETQALNEELLTVNMEFRAKTDELTEINNDMANLLNSSDIATIFLNQKLEIKRFTNRATKIVNLIQSDIGRPVAHISTNLNYNHITRDAKEVLDLLQPKELQVEAKNGQWYAMRINPYRTLDNFIGGVVISFIDISTLKQLEKAAIRLAENIVQTIRYPMVVLDSSFRIVSVNYSFLQLFSLSEPHVSGQVIFTIGNGVLSIPALRELLEELPRHETQFNNQVLNYTFDGVGTKNIVINSHRIVQEETSAELIVISIE